eukprot:4845747-Prymnesium_polylepis.1
MDTVIVITITGRCNHRTTKEITYRGLGILSGNGGFEARLKQYGPACGDGTGGRLAREAKQLNHPPGGPLRWGGVTQAKTHTRAPSACHVPSARNTQRPPPPYHGRPVSTRRTAASTARRP